MTIFRFSVAAIAALLIFGAGYAFSEYRHAEKADLESEKIAAEAKSVRRTIVAKCAISERYLATADEIDAAAFPGYEVRPITLLPDYGFCPQPENDEKILCANDVAAQGGFILGRPPIIGECPRLGIVE